MTQEERTRDEVLNVLIANTQALTLLLADLLAKRKQPVPVTTQTDIMPLPPKPAIVGDYDAAPLGPPLSNPHEMNPTPEAPKQRKPRAPKEQPPAPPPAAPEIQISKPPVKPHKSASDLREALQTCLAKHGMNGTKERLAPFAKLSDVPDAEIDATIARLLAE